MNTYFFHHIHPLSPFHYAFSPATGTNPWTGHVLASYSLFSKKDIFCLFMMVIQGVSM
jgi:hypothetical protein